MCAIVVNDVMVNEIRQGDEGMIVLDQTPFYPEMGGQVGDTGNLWNDSRVVHFKVIDCQAPYKGVIGHQGKMEKGSIRLGDTLTAEIDHVRRQKIANNQRRPIFCIGRSIASLASM